MSKREAITKLAEELIKIYPHLDGVLVDGDMENPVRIIFMSQEDMLELAEETDFEVEELEEETGLRLLEDYSDDDDEGGGFIQ